MATKKAEPGYTTEEVQSTLKVLRALGLEHNYTYDEVEDLLPPELRGPRTLEGWISVNIIGPDDIRDADIRKINALMKRSWPTLEYVRGGMSWRIDPSHMWNEA